MKSGHFSKGSFNGSTGIASSRGSSGRVVIKSMLVGMGYLHKSLEWPGQIVNLPIHLDSHGLYGALRFGPIF